MRRALMLAAFVAVVLIALLPLRLAVDWLGLANSGFSARKVDGSVWRGMITDARWGDIALGTLSTRFSLLSLIKGQIEVQTLNAGGTRFEARVRMGRGGMAVAGVNAVLNVANSFAPLPIEQLELTDVNAGFDDGVCADASGSVRATLSGDIGGIMLANGLSGSVRCDGGAIFLPLQSQSGMEKLAVRLFPDGRFMLNFSVIPNDAAAAARLEQAGFAERRDAHHLMIEGRF